MDGAVIKAVAFDFGGVLAEEGFRGGLKAIGRKNGLNADDFYSTASELVYQTGYVIGMTNESAFWNAVREKTRIAGDDKDLRREILGRFILRPTMLRYVEGLRASEFITAILSDQTNWLDEINEKTPFFHCFDYVFNSFNLKKGKRDPSVFRDVCSAMGLKPEGVLFVDDNVENIRRAQREGLKTIHFRDVESFRKEMNIFLKPRREEV